VGVQEQLPWAKPRFELPLLFLVAVVALSSLHGLNAQDPSRLCLSQAVVHGRLSNDRCFTFDRSVHNGHTYSDKAPGLALWDVPIVEAIRLPPANELAGQPWRLWLTRVLSVGVAFLVCAFLVGRVSEGLAPGFGALSLVAFSIGTLAAPLATFSFDELPCAALAFAGFLFAWRRSFATAGLLLGGALLVEYQAALIVAVVGVYVAWKSRRVRSLVSYGIGVLPGVLLLASYDTLAFGAPWHVSYRYVANVYQADQQGGLFGIRLPRLHATYEVLAGTGGLLVVSPVLFAAVYGLAQLAKTRRVEALPAATVAGAFLLVNCGYFLPYGGSLGPRFFVPALPFLALGLAPSFARRPRTTAALTVVSVAATTVVVVAWASRLSLPDGVWKELAHIPSQLRNHELGDNLDATVLSWVVPGRVWGALLEAGTALAALALAYAASPAPEVRPGMRFGDLGERASVAGLGVVLLAQGSAVAGFPYRAHPDLVLDIVGSTSQASVGQEVDFTVWATNRSSTRGYGDVSLDIDLPRGTELVGRPYYERGSGCRGNGALHCSLDSLSPKMTTPIKFGVKIVGTAPQHLMAAMTAQGVATPTQASFTVLPP
jgi:hypothetical protein